ncbi:hypothetical protein [Bacillus pumilus]|uniref:Rok-like winged helix domain-containing protein n=1 Tax=Bacillus pumilus TaxID=1408 RepID=UPI000D02B639|nr:hypothetical protein [Bacillus pumilus]MDM5320753.1 hypothetical protein [Bacillus pumilus]MDR4995883.1 hypothetical protein [Bacillus altitudinis]PRS31067.1 hypothetical protein C6X99_08015 [Bacillus pumilus]RAP25258.1 hypothetical protein C2W59_00220 [Bacillus pumilus]
MYKEKEKLLKQLEELDIYEKSVYELIASKKRNIKKRIQELDEIYRKTFVPEHVKMYGEMEDRLIAYYEAIQLFENNPERVFSINEIKQLIFLKTGYKIPSFSYFYRKLRAINPYIVRVRHGYYIYSPGYKDGQSPS